MEISGVPGSLTRGTRDPGQLGHSGEPRKPSKKKENLLVFFLCFLLLLPPIRALCPVRSFLPGSRMGGTVGGSNRTKP